jgi:serine/threonine protein kinase
VNLHLQHPRILRIYGGSVNAAGGMLVTEHIGVGSLAAVVYDNASRLTDVVKAQLCSDVAYGLAYMHSQNIWHRQLRAAACTVTHDYRAKIGDFARAKAPDVAVCTVTHFMNEWRWTAPEAYLDNSAGALAAPKPPQRTESAAAAPEKSIFRVNAKSDKADTYSLGMVLFEVYVGKEPWPDASPLALDKFMRYYVEKNDVRKPEGGCGKAREVMEDCWATRPTQRPSAWSVATTFADLIDNNARMVDLYTRGKVSFHFVCLRVAGWKFTRDCARRTRCKEIVNRR